MSNLVPKQREYRRVPHLLVQEVPGFAESREYQSLESHDLELPGVVCGAFARFLTRLQEDALESRISAEDSKSLEVAYQVIEGLASSSDPDVVNVVVVEIFENINCEPRVLEAIKAQLGNTSKLLYGTWIGNGI